VSAAGGAITAVAAIAALLVGAAPRPALAQSCCSPATTPAAALAAPAPPRGELSIGVYAETYALSGGRRGTAEFDYPGDREASAAVLSLAARYGLPSRLALGVVVPFQSRERSDELPGSAGRVSRSAHGLGDVAALAYWSVLPRPGRREWTVGAGIKLATGETRAADDTGELPEELQPGTGANDVLLTTAYAEGLGEATLAGALTWRLAGTLTKIDTNPLTGAETRRDHRFGNELVYAATAAWSPDGRWGFELGVRGRHAEPDEATQLNPDGTTGAVRTLPSTGGERVWLAPALRYAALAQRNTVTLGVMLPAYEDLRGSQLASRAGLRLAVEGRL
jgi:hypothetical protein